MLYKKANKSQKNYLSGFKVGNKSSGFYEFKILLRFNYLINENISDHCFR